MQNCSLCKAQSHDSASHCSKCHADLKIFSETNVTLQRLQSNPRVESVILSVAADACPACQEVQGSYAKDSLPELPIQGCSHANGCRCFYQPVLSEIYP